MVSNSPLGCLLVGLKISQGGPVKDSQVSVSVVYLDRNAFSECSTCVPHYTNQSDIILMDTSLMHIIYFVMSLYVARFDLSVAHLIS